MFPLLPALRVEGALFPRVCLCFEIPGSIDLLHGNGDRDEVGEYKVPAYILVLGVLHQVVVIGVALGIGIKVAHLQSQLNDLSVVQSPFTFA